MSNKLSEVDADPDSETGILTNEQRAAAGLAAVQTFAAWSGQASLAEDLGEEPGAQDAVMEVVGDLLANLLHLAAWHGIEADRLIEQGRYHFDAEVEEEAE